MWKRLFNNFMVGLSRGLGFALGMTVIFAIIVYLLVFILSRMVTLPIVGDFIADMIKTVNASLKGGVKMRGFQTILFYTLAAVIIAFDQLTKFLIRTLMVPNQSIPIIPYFFHLTYVQNPGAAFGILPGQIWFLTVTGAIVLAVILFYHFNTSPQDLLLQVSLAFIFSGSIGNVIDRVIYSHVVDFIDFRFWPVFNIADIMINVGVAYLIIRLLVTKKETKIDY